MATLKVGKASDQEAKPTQTASKDWYVDADGNPTNDSSLATQHIASKGQEILPHIATKYGFVDGAPKAKNAPKAQAPAENKAVEKPSDIKVADNRPGANKVEVKK